LYVSCFFTLFYLRFYWFYYFTPYYERDIGTMYILPQHDFIPLLCIKIFYVCLILSLSFILIVFSVVFRLASLHIEPWSNSAGTQSLPEDGIVLPKHVGAIVKSKETYNLVHLLVYHYIFDNARYRNPKKGLNSFWGTLSLFSQYWRLFPKGWSGCSVKYTTGLHLVLR
jgi:hypothetical protein